MFVRPVLFTFLSAIFSFPCSHFYSCLFFSSTFSSPLVPTPSSAVFTPFWAFFLCSTVLFSLYFPILLCSFFEPLFSLLFFPALFCSSLVCSESDFSDLRNTEVCFLNVLISHNRQTFFKQKYNKDTTLDISTIFYQSWGDFRQWSQIKNGLIKIPNPSDGRNLNNFIILLVLKNTPRTLIEYGICPFWPYEGYLTLLWAYGNILPFRQLDFSSAILTTRQGHHAVRHNDLRRWIV